MASPISKIVSVAYSTASAPEKYTMTDTFPFLKLPFELREIIYRKCFVLTPDIYIRRAGLLRVNRQVNQELTTSLLRRYDFIRVCLSADEDIISHVRNRFGTRLIRDDIRYGHCISAFPSYRMTIDITDPEAAGPQELNMILIGASDVRRLCHAMCQLDESNGDYAEPWRDYKYRITFHHGSGRGEYERQKEEMLLRPVYQMWYGLINFELIGHVNPHHPRVLSHQFYGGQWLSLGEVFRYLCSIRDQYLAVKGTSAFELKELLDLSQQALRAWGVLLRQVYEEDSDDYTLCWLTCSNIVIHMVSGAHLELAAYFAARSGGNVFRRDVAACGLAYLWDVFNNDAYGVYTVTNGRAHLEALAAELLTLLSFKTQALESIASAIELTCNEHDRAFLGKVQEGLAAIKMEEVAMTEQDPEDYSLRERSLHDYPCQCATKLRLFGIGYHNHEELARVIENEAEGRPQQLIG